MQLTYKPKSKYLGVIRDQKSVTNNTESLNKKTAGKNNLLRLLTRSSLGANPRTLRTSVLCLAISAAENASLVWYRSSHAQQYDITVKETMRRTTGYLQITNIQLLYILAGIASSIIRREAAASEERRKQATDQMHPVIGQPAAPLRFQS